MSHCPTLHPQKFASPWNKTRNLCTERFLVQKHFRGCFWDCFDYRILYYFLSLLNRWHTVVHISSPQHYDPLQSVSEWMCQNSLQLKSEKTAIGICPIQRKKIFIFCFAEIKQKQKNKQKPIHTFTFSRLNYYNSVIMGPSKKSIRCLQLIQNAAVRIIRNITKIENITPILKSLRLFQGGGIF